MSAVAVEKALHRHYVRENRIASSTSLHGLTTVNLQSLATEHVDLRLYPPRGSLLTCKGSPYIHIDVDSLRKVVGLIKDNKAFGMPGGHFESMLLRCFVDCMPYRHRDPWALADPFCYQPVSHIRTYVNVSIEETRVYQAYEREIPSPSLVRARDLFDQRTLAMTAVERCRLLESIIHVHRIKPFVPRPMVISVDDELFKAAIHALTSEQLHELHLLHCCPWVGVVGSTGCRCTNYSSFDTRTRLVSAPVFNLADFKPQLLPEIVWGIEGADTMRKRVKKAMSDSGYQRKCQREYAEVEQKRYREHQDRTTKDAIAQGLMRLLAAYEMGASIYGAAVVGTRFTRFFVLGPNRIAIEMLSHPREEHHGIPKALPWTSKEQLQMKRGERPAFEGPQKPVEGPEMVGTSSPARSPRGDPSCPNVSQAPKAATQPQLAPTTSTAEEATLSQDPEPSTPPQNRTRAASHSGFDNHADEVRYGMPTVGHIPAAHVLNTPPRPRRPKTSFESGLTRLKSATLPKGRGRRGRAASAEPSSQASSSSLSWRQPTTSAALPVRPVAASQPWKYKPLPQIPRPQPQLHVNALPPDSRPGVSFKTMFSDDPFSRLPWSFASASEASPDPQYEVSSSDNLSIDKDSVTAFSNLLFAGMIRLGQHPVYAPHRVMGPLPITNHFPRDNIIAILANATGLPAELSERIVDMSLSLDEQHWVQQERKKHFCLTREKTFHKTIGSLPDLSNSLDLATHLNATELPHGHSFPPVRASVAMERPTDMWAMERALDNTVRLVPVSRGEMEALITRQLITDRTRYFYTYPAKLWSNYWTERAQNRNAA